MESSENTLLPREVLPGQPWGRGHFPFGKPKSPATALSLSVSSKWSHIPSSTRKLWSTSELSADCPSPPTPMFPPSHTPTSRQATCPTQAFQGRPFLSGWCPQGPGCLAHHIPLTSWQLPTPSPVPYKHPLPTWGPLCLEGTCSPQLGFPNQDKATTSYRAPFSSPGHP